MRSSPIYSTSRAEASDDADLRKGRIIHAFGEENGKWVSVGVWESQAAFERYRDERILPAMRQALRDAMVDAGPPPQESFEVKHIIKP